MLHMLWVLKREEVGRVVAARRKLVVVSPPQLRNMHSRSRSRSHWGRVARMRRQRPQW